MGSYTSPYLFIDFAQSVQKNARKCDSTVNVVTIWGGQLKRTWKENFCLEIPALIGLSMLKIQRFILQVPPTKLTDILYYLRWSPFDDTFQTFHHILKASEMYYKKPKALHDNL